MIEKLYLRLLDWMIGDRQVIINAKVIKGLVHVTGRGLYRNVYVDPV